MGVVEVKRRGREVEEKYLAARKAIQRAQDDGRISNNASNY
jgi:hypothetical protein